MTSPATVDAPALPADVATAVVAIADRLRSKTPEQVIAIGERTGWWSADLVDWVVDGSHGSPPGDAVRTPMPLPGEHRDEPTVIAPPPVPPSDPVEEPDTPPLAAVPAPPVDVDVPTAGSAYVAALPGRELGVDRTYQRPLDEARVRRMAASWDPRMVGIIEVSDRGHGHTPRYAIVGGQHRVAAAGRAMGADVWLVCNIHEGLTVADEARLMHELDRTSKKLTGFEKWHARRAAGDETVLAVEEVAAAHGLRVAYGAAAQAYQAPLLMGLGQLVHRHGADLNPDRLRNALANTRPEQLRHTATVMREVDGGSLHQLMTRAIAGAYNRTAGDGGRISGDRA